MDSAAAAEAAIENASELLARIRAEVARVIVGQAELVDSMLVGLLADGHVLLEGVPGLAKSLAVETLAAALGGSYRRIQFTPDLLPADLLGTQVYHPKTGEWSVREGPVFANFLLADEINRAPAKVQSALLEAMQERQVSLFGETRPLPRPFLVLATQNPIELEGTYPLPEAQVDRFLLKVLVGFPGREEEERIIERMATTGAKPAARSVARPEEILEVRALLDRVRVDPRLRRYVVELVFASREPEAAGLGELRPLILFGASPRASIALVQAARARALLEGRAYATPYDVKRAAPEVLRHRIVTTWEAEAEGVSSEDLVGRILDHVPVP